MTSLLNKSMQQDAVVGGESRQRSDLTGSRRQSELTVTPSDSKTGPQAFSRLPRRVAMVLLWTVFPLIWVGGLVTTFDAGMAVPDWPNTYNYNMFAYPVRDWFFGPWDLFVEHGHRLLGTLAGIFSIGFVVIAHWKDSRRWLRRLSWGVLALVILQGLLGGARVLLDDRIVAQIHGTLGPGFFALCAVVTVLTGTWWQAPTEASGGVTPSLSPAPGYWRWMTSASVGLAVISYIQLGLGAAIRHIVENASPAYLNVLVWSHVVTAIAIGVLAIGLCGFAGLRFGRGAGVRVLALAIVSLVLMQLGLGSSTWVIKYGWPAWFDQLGFAAHFVIPEKSFVQMNIVTLHAAVGSLILASSSVFCVCCLRLQKVARDLRLQFG